MSKKDLSPLQEKFCQLYHKTGNATQSYIGAGYKAKSPQIAAEKASRLMASNGKVRERLSALQKAAAKRSEIKIDDLIRKNVEIAFSKLSDVIRIVDGGIELLEEADLDVLDSISFSKSSSSSSSDTKHGSNDSESESSTLSIKRSDRLKALKELARLTNAYDEGKGNSDKGDRGSKLERVLESTRRFKK